MVRSICFTPGKEIRYPLYRTLAGPYGRCGRVREMSSPWGDPRTIQPVASRYTDWAISAHTSYLSDRSTRSPQPSDLQDSQSTLFSENLATKFHSRILFQMVFVAQQPNSGLRRPTVQVIRSYAFRHTHTEGPATGHLNTGFSWFPCV